MEKIDYLNWIIKEYRIAGNPHSRKEVKYKRKSDFHANLATFTGESQYNTYTDYSDEFMRKINLELEYLIDINREYDCNIETDKVTEPQSHLNYNISWNSDYPNSDLLELIKALVVSKAIKGTQKDIIKAFSAILKVEIKNPGQSLQSLKNSRNADSETKFLDKLRKNLKAWYIGENKKTQK